MNSQQKPVGFLFKSGRKARLSEGSAVPGEFFYGLRELSGLGQPVLLLEEDELGTGLCPAWLEPLITHGLDALAGLNGASLSRLAQSGTLARLNSCSTLIATTNSQGRALAALTWAGLLKTPVLFLAMGAWPESSGWKNTVLSRLYKRVSLAPIGQPEAQALRKRLPAHPDLAYLRFGVDHRFWTPAATQPGQQEPYVLAIGNDAHRDWDCLAKAWRTDFPLLKIVTRRPVPPSAGRLEIIAGDWNRQLLSDEAVRDLYRNALFVVLPLLETLQPSGQSAALQAMACGKAVLLSAISGLWEPDLLIDGKVCGLVPPSDPIALARAVNDLLGQPGQIARMGSAARRLVEEHFTLDRMAQDLQGRLSCLNLDNPAISGAPSSAGSSSGS
ncbi:MAG: glycosyltransferase [Rhodospirillales bacterium]|nr:MAG: glycosyltransferase [Rhodospirillales bacterium]